MISEGLVDSERVVVLKIVAEKKGREKRAEKTTESDWGT